MSIELVARAKKTKLHGDSTAKLLLIVLADYANDDGMAWPSVATMAQEVEKSERSIQLLLRKLEKTGLIRKGDQKLVGKYAKGRRPVVYKLFPKKTKSENPDEAHHDAENRGETDFTPETRFTGETDFTPQVKPASPHGRNPLHPTGETHFALGVKPTSPKPSQEPSIEPSRESTRASQTENPTKTDDPRTGIDASGYTPDTDPDATALAAELHLDVEHVFDDFRDWARDKGMTSVDWPAAFRRWMRREAQYRERDTGVYGAPATDAGGGAAGERDVRSRARRILDTSTRIKAALGDRRHAPEWIAQVADMLADGMEPARIVELLCEAAAGMPPVDDLDTIA
ncbi:helix-turn-helix domain-containing protein [Bifidobacterium stellenboschense]|uniref:Cryptic prophage protein n=1 Tax=Bifidobacterium stellenboschense TaxID=762211 RepID=A0A087DQP2_9BIFI|nr:helix-turn-helix domain-containing protein [Bifidobacterium stellenboschense]KFI97842.1 cryptic prophage protein [Bifidobacterium stellenboschense]